jgi:hypothetical protein
LCREHGLQLINLLTAATNTTVTTTMNDSDDNNTNTEGGEAKSSVSLSVPAFHLFGIVKEVGVDDIGLLEFTTQYFQNLPIYYDATNAMYTAFGKRTIFQVQSWNPLAWYRSFHSIGTRIATQKITGNYKGEGIIQGGILIFDARGTIRYSINEEIGTPFDTEAIAVALRTIVSMETDNTKDEL